MKRLLNWYYGSASIRKKLVISYLLLITVPILVLGVYSFSVSKRNMERQTEETIRNNVRLMASDLVNIQLMAFSFRLLLHHTYQISVILRAVYPFFPDSQKIQIRSV